MTDEATAPASGATQPTESAPALSGDQMLAREAMATARSEMIKPDGSTNLAAKTRFREASDFLYSNGPRPSWLTPESAPTPEELARPATDQSGFKPGELLDAVYPIPDSPSDYRFDSFNGSAVETQPGELNEIRGVFHQLGLSRQDAKQIFSEALRMTQAVASGSVVLGEESDQALDAILRESWGAQYNENLALSEKAFNRLPQALRDDITTNLPGVLYSPWVLSALARAQRAFEARGGK